MPNPVMKRAWSTLEIKAVADTGSVRTFEAIASTPRTDRQTDVVDPMGAKFSLPIPFLWQHNSDMPIGQITEAKATKNGISVKGYVETLSDPPSLKDDLDRAWAMIKAKLVRGLSIGFIPLDAEPIDPKSPWGGMHFLSWDWLELSAVTIPANADATFTTIKSIDQSQMRAASGASGSVRLTIPPGVTGKPSEPPKGIKVKTYQEQIASSEAKRAADVARMSAMMDASGEEGRSLDEMETQEYDGLDAEVKQIDGHLVRLKNQAKLVASTAAPVIPEAGTDPAAGTNARQGVRIEMAPHGLPKGTAFTRYAMALCRAKGNLPQALEISKIWHDTTPEVETVLKAAVTSGTTTDSTWASPLALPNTMASEFVEFLRPQELLGKIQGLRRVPFNVRFPRATSGSTSGWVGQGAPKPVSRMSFETMTMAFTKIATIVVLTDELVRFSNPAAEALVRDDMARAITLFTDQQFIDPSVTASVGISPASITNGILENGSTGTTIAQITTDVATLWKVLLTGNISPTAPVFVMNPRTALFLSLVRTTQDIIAFPGLSMMGGTFFGIPVVTSNAVPIESDGTTSIVFMDAANIFLADDGGVTLDVSMEASLQMDGAPSAGAQQLVSLWQNNMVGLRAERYVNYQRRREAAVAVLSQVAY